MIEHVINPLEFLRLFAAALAEDGLLYLETPRLDWILDNKTFYDFPYEHCAYFSDDFMLRLLKASGFEAVSLRKNYDGQYFSICARKTGSFAPIAPMQLEEASQVKLRLSLLERHYKEYQGFLNGNLARE